MPERVGEPSVFQHVIYIIKENRTYDQVLGDVTNGNGEADLCIFGERVTPNEHKFVRDFVLLGQHLLLRHLERGRPSMDGQRHGDGLHGARIRRLAAQLSGGRRRAGYARTPWPIRRRVLSGTTRSAHGKSVCRFRRIHHVHSSLERSGARRASRIFSIITIDFISGTDAIDYSAASRTSRRCGLIIVTNYVGWDLDVPDIFRAAQFIKDLKQYEAADNFPNLVIIWLPNDHTSAHADSVRPRRDAQVADNDLAFGQMVEAVSHSANSGRTPAFSPIEDDPQDGWDHRQRLSHDGLCHQPLHQTQRGGHTQYNQTSLLRTMELMLGLPPMNQMDATATPMFDCFTNTPDFTAYRCRDQ